MLGVVGAGGIGWELIRAAQMGMCDVAMDVTVVIFLMVMGAELLTEWLRRRSDAATPRATA